MKKIVPPSLIQRCSSKKVPFNELLLTGTYLDLDYMGSSEFEWGAIPKFQRAMLKKMDQTSIRSVKYKEFEFWVMIEISKLVDYIPIIERLVDKQIQLKERSGIHEKDVLYVGKVAKYDHPQATYKYDVWFDLDNEVIFARDPDVLTNLRISIGNSVRFMDETAKQEAK